MERDSRENTEFWPEDCYTRAEFAGTALSDVVRVARAEFTETHRELGAHSHPGCVELTYHCRGQQIYRAGGRDYQVRAGDMFITYPDEIHGSGGRPEERSMLYFMIFRLTPRTQSLLGLSPEDTAWVRSVLWSCSRRVFRGSRKIPGLMQQVLDLNRQKEPMWEARIRYVLTELLFQVCRSILLDGTSGPEMPPDFAALVAEIDRDLSRSYSVSDMADRLYLSESHFKRKFKEYTGFSPGDYIMRRKLARAEELLRDPEARVSEVADSLNFSSSQHFSAAFRKYTGLTPTQFRNKEKQNPG